MSTTFLTYRRRFLVAIALLLLLPLQLAGAAAHGGGGSCCGQGNAVADVVRYLTSLPCHDADGDVLPASGQVATRAADCGAIATELPAPCDCAAHCGVVAWSLVAPPFTLALQAPSTDGIPFAQAWVGDPARTRLERPPSTRA